MRQVSGRQLWVGNASDLLDPQKVMTEGIQAVLELAASESFAVLPRELIRCRFPLCDGEENPTWLLCMAVENVATLLRSKVPVLICCSAGMSRSVIIAAGGLALAEQSSLEEALKSVVADGPADVSPALFLQLKLAISELK
jgi:hypothetical protein